MWDTDSRKHKMDYKDVISQMKCETYEEADAKAITIFNDKKNKIGKLVPVGNWILNDKEKIEHIQMWRQRSMRMFLTQFESEYEKTYNYLKNLSIAQQGRLLCMLYDDNDRLIGHLGIADVDGDSGELDNLMRGVNGGDPRLIYYAEATFLDWCFKNLKLKQSDVRVLSYNWLVISLHDEVGYRRSEDCFLKKYEKNGTIFHDVVDKNESNVNYKCTKMLLWKDDFYKNVSWLS